MSPFARGSRAYCLVVAAIAATCILQAGQVAKGVGVAMWWDPTGVTPAAGGSGTWDEIQFNWLTPSINSPLPTVPWVDGSIANFSGGSTPTVTLGSSVIADEINFNTTGYTIAGSGGNTLTLGDLTPTIDVGSGTANTFRATISANISAASPVNIVDTFTGTGTTPNNILSLTGTTNF